jgi:hypothetical protein
MAWDATGFRILLGVSEAYEYGESLVYYNGEVISASTQRRLVTVARAEWRGLSEAGAAAKTATVGGWMITQRDRVDESNQWRVTEELTALGTWQAAP